MVSDTPPNTVGLVGDGDEIDAISDVERAFGIVLDYSDAPHWRTAGDVFNSLKKALPPEDRNRPDLWDKFAFALSGQTFVDPRTITPESPLLLPRRAPWPVLQRIALLVWLAAFICVLGLVTIAILSAG